MLMTLAAKYTQRGEESRAEASLYTQPSHPILVGSFALLEQMARAISDRTGLGCAGGSPVFFFSKV